MDNSCPATPLVLTETDSKSPLRVAISSPESEGGKSPSRDSPDSTCVICLGKLQNKSFTDSCLHQFCFQCLLQWSKVKAECPLCKQSFKSIIHNVRSNLDYDQYHVEAGEPRCVLSDFVHSFNFDFIQVDRRFRYRSTVTREYFRELAESILNRNNLITDDYYQIPSMAPVDPTWNQNTRCTSHIHNSNRQRGTTEFRRSIYTRDLWVQDLADISGRYRECTPQFYRENPAQIHRIVPWLNREVNVLLENLESQAAYILNRIVSFLSQHSIRSREFRELVEPYFGSRTDHFIHELYTFAHSVYDIAGFDQHAVYGPNPHYATEVQEIFSSNDDSDIEVLKTIKGKEKKIKKSSKEELKSIFQKKNKKAESQVDEPVAGPSGISSKNTSSAPFDVCESDRDDIEILDFVKPKPELIILSSGDDDLLPSDSAASKDEPLELIVHKHDKLTRNRLPSDEDYVPPGERKSRYKNSKGKCKSNGFGLKGKQKQKYIKSKKYRSSSIDSSSSDDSTDTSESDFSSDSSSSDHKSKKKRGKATRKKSKKKAKSYHKTSQKDNKKKRYVSSSSDTDKITKKLKQRVKSCVIIPSSKSCYSPTLSRHKTSESSKSRCHSHRSPASYWSIVPNPEKLKSRRKNDDQNYEKKRKYKYLTSSGEEKPNKRNTRHSTCVEDSSLSTSSDESQSDRKSYKSNLIKIFRKINYRSENEKRKNSRSENGSDNCRSLLNNLSNYSFSVSSPTESSPTVSHDSVI